MADLHSTLEKLGPVEYTDIPQDDLVTYLKSHLTAGELICNSVPAPPGGDSFETSTPSESQTDAASSAKDISSSDARYPPAHEDHTSLNDSWGKPLKVSAKDNAADVKVYKMAGHDRHGAWFARRSVHEGLSFSKFRNAMKWEFLESLATKGGPGAGAVRGIGVDRRIEDVKVDKLGKMQVYELSAQFPGPTTPRDFIVLLMTSEHGLTEKSSVDGKYIPRHFMIVSKPVTHTDAPERDGYIRGHYESVELIREVPLHKKSGAESDSKESASNPELNPVEWIMVTRSDPGGGLPRFMVERGTPASITGDVTKFFNWACKKEDIPDADEESAVEEAMERRKSIQPEEQEASARGTDGAIAESATPTQGGYLQSGKNFLQAGLDAYAPAAVASAAQGYLQPSDSTNSLAQTISSDSDNESDTSSYESADDHLETPLQSADSLPLSISPNSRPSTPSSTTKLNHHDKEAAKLDHHKKKLEAKLKKKREQEAEKLKQHEDNGKNSSADLLKLKEKSEKEVKKHEERHEKEMAKVEERKTKELDKAKKKRQKLADRDAMSKLTRERDDFRSRVEIVQKENELLRQQIAEVQRENNVIVGRVKMLAEGEAVLEGAREELKKKGKDKDGKAEIKAELWN